MEVLCVGGVSASLVTCGMMLCCVNIPEHCWTPSSPGLRPPMKATTKNHPSICTMPQGNGPRLPLHIKPGGSNPLPGGGRRWKTGASEHSQPGTQCLPQPLTHHSKGDQPGVQCAGCALPTPSVPAQDKVHKTCNSPYSQWAGCKFSMRYSNLHVSSKTL